MHQIQAWQMHQTAQPLQQAKLSISSLSADEVLVRVSGCGVCHTDLGFFYEGIIKACRDESIRYAFERQTFGKPIAEHQLVQQMIAHMQQNIDIGELLVLKAGWLKNQGIRNARETSMAKWYCTEAANRAANDAVQIHGAYGYSDEYNVERHLRNTKSAVIYEGTSQIHTLLQAAYAMGKRKDKPMRCEMPTYDPDNWQAERSK